MERVTLLRYDREKDGAALLLVVWDGLCSDPSLLPSLFWQTAEPMTLESFLALFLSGPRVLYIVQDRMTGEFAGVVFLDSIVPGHKAMLSIGMLPGYRGRGSVDAARQACRDGLEAFDLASVWTATPHLTGKTLARRIGAEEMATLPEFALIGGRPRDVSFYRLKKEDVCLPSSP